MIRLKKLAKQILEKKKERLFGQSDFKPMKPLFKDPGFNKFMVGGGRSLNIQEMPHADYGLLGVDLGIEKYNVPEEIKQEYMRQYQAGGLYGYVSRYKKWLKITDGGIKAVKSPPTNQKAILPDDWEKYIDLNM